MASPSPDGTTRPRPADGTIAPCPPPMGTLDLENATDAELQPYGLPTRAAFRNNPAAAAFRRSFLRPRPSAPPLEFLSELKVAEAAPPPGIVHIAAPASRPVQKSMNWSGGYVTPRDGRSFVSVMANWTVPAVSPPPGGTASEYQSSTWIGLDGQRLYLDSSLPQIGTRQRWLAKPVPHAEYCCWFQWWARGQDLPIHFLALPVDPGDEISAIITVLDETTVCCNLKNVSKGVALPAFDASAPPGMRISGATAEWIMERPSPMGSDGWEPYAFPLYKNFAFTDCVAESAEPGKPDRWEHDLESARLIRTYEIERNPACVRTISAASRDLGPPQRLELTRITSSA